MIRLVKNEEDVNYVIDAHWKVYSNEYHYDSSFIQFFTEAIATHFQEVHSHGNKLWVLEVDSLPKGCIAMIRIDESTAQLRWLLLESEARGRGYGKKLIHQVIEACKEDGYKKLFLWTNDTLSTARALYQKYGFRIVKSRSRELSNQKVTEERWELVL
jgi:GNAT superfamily N-acetyltransferase